LPISLAGLLLGLLGCMRRSTQAAAACAPRVRLAGPAGGGSRYESCCTSICIWACVGCVWGGGSALCAAYTDETERGRCAARGCVRDCERAGTGTRGAHGVSCVLSPPRCCARCSSGPRSSTAPWRSAARVRALLAASAFGVVGAPARLGDRFWGPSAARTRPHAGVIGANARCGIPARG
jgi:hypothetical protein